MACYHKSKLNRIQLEAATNLIYRISAEWRDKTLNALVYNKSYNEEKKSDSKKLNPYPLPDCNTQIDDNRPK